MPAEPAGLRLRLSLFPLLALACGGPGGTRPTGSGGAGAEGGGGAGVGGSGGTGGGTTGPKKTRLAFGSCMEQDKPKPVLELATASKPDLFAFMGDNIYGDTTSVAVMQA